MTTPEQQIAEAREICALIRAGKPVPCGKGPADEYLLALDAALATALSDSKRKDDEIAGLKRDLAMAHRVVDAKDAELKNAVRVGCENITAREAAESRLKDAEAALAEARREIADAMAASQAPWHPRPIPDTIKNVVDGLMCNVAGRLNAVERAEKAKAERDRLAGALAKVSETRDHYEKELADAKAKRDKRIYELTEIAYLASLREHLRAALASPAPKEDSK